MQNALLNADSTRFFHHNSNRPMNIYIHAPGNFRNCRQLVHLIGSIIDPEQVILLPGNFPVTSFLDFGMHTGDVLILVPADSGELEHLLSMKDILQDFRLILILPDEGEETITRGHALMPRFLTFSNNDLDEVIRVLGRMIAQ